MASATSFYDFEPLDKKGQPYPLSTLKNKVVLIVNTASKCGFTPQFEGLETLYKKIKEKYPDDFIILGFPCNQFMNQDPGDNDTIQSFCQLNYGVTFPVLSKLDVNGPTASPLFEYLKAAAPGLLGLKRVKWNFEKFLVGRDGEVKVRWASTTKPESLEGRILEELSKGVSEKKKIVDDDKVERALKIYGWYDEKEKTNREPHGTIQAVVYKLFATEFTSWEMFATTRYDDSIRKPKGAEFLSLEYIHNNVHSWAGGEWMQYEDEAGEGAGHMSDVDVSAFDPIFYLHHCNIDRLLAIWQILHPDLWFNQPQEDEPKSSDELWPFHINKKGDYWTSDACRDVTKLHYSYADLKKPGEGFKEGEEVDFLDGLRRSINKQYGSMRRRVLGDESGIAGLNRDYIVNVVYDPFAYDGAPCTIYFFLGNPEEEGATCIGSVYNFR
ncbi:hypothetical protein JMJ35_001569 [Cladonia borealis]|uniref:Glutathione peroxidase n=1 Tax=Cladonia borealis TaxID=184061 RepID=A0AA39V9H1_9LECA|nr:hypothetical protein JMJ35_001569 [Cladonia borealis]